MGNAELAHLFQPGIIGRVELKNRIIMAAMDLEYDAGGYVSARTQAFYVERAKGGAGLITVGGVSPLANGMLTPRMLRIDQNDYIPSLRDLTTALHKNGAKVAIQLLHSGRDAMPADDSIPIAPSAISSRLTRRTPRALETAEIPGVIAAYAQAVVRAREAGFDAVEILGSSGFLISQFMSPLTNRRDDHYGGDLNARLRFPLEIVAAVRKATGDDFTLIFRHTGDDFIRGGHGQAEAKIVAQILARSAIDAISVQVGWEETPIPTAHMIVPRAAYAYLAQGIKEAVDLPVIACNRINDPLVAERVLAEGQADFIAMARALLADPAFPVKAAHGSYEDINTCVGCNQGCLDKVFSGQAVHCLVNPDAGRESELPLSPAERAKRVVVVGGGPAGLETARVLALRGHRVTLFEKEDRLGGQVAIAARNPYKQEFAELVRYLSAQVRKQGVDVRLGLAATAEAIMAERPDAVVIATGGTPKVPEIPGAELSIVVQARDVLAGRAVVGRKVVIIGGRGTACDVALFLARRTVASAEAAVFLAQWGAVDAASAVGLTRQQRPITVVRRGQRVADDLGRTVRWIIVGEMAAAGIQTVTGVEYSEINERGVVVLQNGERRLLEADTVVLAAGLTPCGRLATELVDRVEELYSIGDAREIGDALAAVHDGSKIGRQV